jgi:hypothetical protein
MLSICHRRKVRREREAAARKRDAEAVEKIAQLQGRKVAAEGYLIPRQRRNHWREAVAGMIHSGRVE